MLGQVRQLFLKGNFIGGGLVLLIELVESLKDLPLNGLIPLPSSSKGCVENSDRNVHIGSGGPLVETQIVGE